MKICKNCSNHFEASKWRCPKCGKEPFHKHGIVELNLESGLTKQELGYPQESFAKLFSLETTNFWFRSRNRLILWAISKYYNNAIKMLEVGCGTGYVLQGIAENFPDMNLSGNDISVKGLSFASKRINSVDFIQFDASNIPFIEEFDLIGAFDVIEHIEEDLQVLKEINKALVKSGGVIITVPQHQLLWSQTDEMACHKRRYGVKEIKDLLAQSGFEIIRSTSFITLLFPFMLLSRQLAPRNNRAELNPEYELKLPKAINYIFEKICDIERYFIKQGLSFPFGGSLLVMARKAKITN